MRPGRLEALVLSTASTLALCLWVSLVRAGDAPDPDPFSVPADSLAAHVGRIALVPPGAPADLVGAQDASAEFAKEVEHRLMAAGFRVVPAESTAALWEEASQTMGGMFDPRTGRRDPARYAQVRARVRRGVRERLRADVTLRASIVVRDAEFKSGEASWDGVTRKVGGNGILNTLLMEVPQGRLPVLSLEVDVSSPEGDPVYRRLAGLQPLVRVDKKQTQEISPEGRYGDATVRALAVDRALGPWLERVRPVAMAQRDSLVP